MDHIAYSLQDRIAVQVIEKLRENIKFEPVDSFATYDLFRGENAMLVAIKGESIHADFLNRIGAERIIFVSRHSSAKGVMSFTAHATGNWSSGSDFGGRPRELSVASPRYMLAFLQVMKCIEGDGMPVTYEATHHGPLLDVPSLFVEIGPSPDMLDAQIAGKFAAGVMKLIKGPVEPYGKVAVGIGGIHYPEKFTRLALDGKYTFSHIMSKYYTGEQGMLSRAIERSEERAEIVVIDWKSVRSENKARIVAELEGLGMDYVKV